VLSVLQRSGARPRVPVEKTSYGDFYVDVSTLVAAEAEATRGDVADSAAGGAAGSSKFECAGGMAGVRRGRGRPAELARVRVWPVCASDAGASSDGGRMERITQLAPDLRRAAD
jgi:hypothetical protein